MKPTPAQSILGFYQTSLVMVQPFFFTNMLQ
ncbi:Uncharacterised protein [Serratia marcescens]|nr:Uncharacterised protein [Serratia marcescens]